MMGDENKTEARYPASAEASAAALRAEVAAHDAAKAAAKAETAAKILEVRMEQLTKAVDHLSALYEKKQDECADHNRDTEKNKSEIARIAIDLQGKIDRVNDTVVPIRKTISQMGLASILSAGAG